MPHPWQDEEEGLGQHGEPPANDECVRLPPATLPGSGVSSLEPMCTYSCRCAQGDIILVGLRDYQDEKADVILK